MSPNFGAGLEETLDLNTWNHRPGHRIGVENIHFLTAKHVEKLRGRQHGANVDGAPSQVRRLSLTVVSE